MAKRATGPFLHLDLVPADATSLRAVTPAAKIMPDRRTKRSDLSSRSGVDSEAHPRTVGWGRVAANPRAPVRANKRIKGLCGAKPPQKPR